jgi:acetyl esterase/lipase
MSIRAIRGFAAVLLCAGLSTIACAKLRPAASWATEVETRYNYTSDLAYVTENNVELKVDIYGRHDVQNAQPARVFMHGGFWVVGSKGSRTLLNARKSALRSMLS